MVERPETWPAIEGLLEFVDGKLFYMPPCGDRQQDTTADVVTTLGVWRRTHRDFVVGGNEAGMLFDGDARGADAAVWRRSALGPHEGKFRRVPPILAVEVKGELEELDALRAKAAWYLSHGVEIVWLLVPESQTAVVVTRDGEQPIDQHGQMPAHPSLPDLEPALDELFAQVSGL